MIKAGSILFFLFTITSWTSYGQSELQGRVTAQDGTPLPYASVYLDNSSFGTQTDENGYYKFDLPIGIIGDLIVSYVGFETFNKTISVKQGTNKLNISLKSVVLDEVQVSGRRKAAWKKNWAVFEKTFLGRTWRSEYAKILNPEIVSLWQDDSKKYIYARANEPIIVENRALGYLIKVDMRSFRTDGTYTIMSSTNKFEILTTDSAEERNSWEVKRSFTYNNSLKKYLAQMAKGEVNNSIETYQLERGFKTFSQKTNLSYELKAKRIKKVNPLLLIRNKEKAEFKLISKKTLLFVKNDLSNIDSPFKDRPYEISTIVLPENNFIFDKNGWVIYPKKMIISGFWGNEGIADLLPRDYQHTEEETDIFNEDYLTKISPKPITNDTLQLSIANPKVKNTLIRESAPDLFKEKKEFNSFWADQVFEISPKEHGLPFFQVLRKIPGLTIVELVTKNGVVREAVSVNLSTRSEASVLLDGMFLPKEEAYAILQNLETSNVEKVATVKYDTSYFGPNGRNGVLVIWTKGSNFNP